MSTPVEFRLTIPLASEGHRGPALYFTRWLPETPEDGVVVPGRGMAGRFWADQECVSFVPCYQETDQGRVDLEIAVNRLRAAVEGISVTEEMAALITRLSTETHWIDDHLHATYDPDLLAEHRRLIEGVYLCAVEGCNAVVGHLRALKGQYWANTVPVRLEALPGQLRRMNARVRVGESGWVRCACSGSTGVKMWGPDSWRCVAQDDWSEVRDRAAGGRRPPIVGTLLAIAEELQSQGHDRAALIEAVSALEIAVNQFVEQADPAGWFGRDPERFGVAGLQAHRRHLGFTATVAYLLPLLFGEAQVPTQTLKDCRAAIEERNNVIHNGKRAVGPADLDRYLAAVRRLCDFLGSWHRGE